jgi:hypothetical protein
VNRLWVVAAVAAANAVVAVSVAFGLTFYVLVAVIGVVVTIVVFQRPQRGLLILALALPFDGLRIPLHLPKVASNWVEAMVFLSVAAAVVAKPGLARPETGRAWPGWATGIMGLIVLGFLSVRMVAPFEVAVGIKAAFQAVAMAFVAWRCPLDAKERDRLVSILMVTGAITAAFGLIQQALGPATLNSWGYKYQTNIRFSGSFLRSFSTFIQPFPFAFFLMIVILIGIPIAFNDMTRLRNKVFVALLPLYGLGLLVAVVRGAWLGTAVGLLFLGIRKHRILLLGIPVVLLVLAVGPSTSGSRATSSATGQARVQTWQDHLYEVGDNPLGIGMGTIGAAAQKLNVLKGGSRGYTFDGIGGDSAYQPDNQYFLYTLELGLVGLWFFVLLLMAAFRTAVRVSERTGGEDSAFALGTAAVVVAYAVAGLVATILEIAPTVYFFWLLLGTTSAISPDRKRGRVPPVALRPVPAKHPERGVPAVQPV